MEGFPPHILGVHHFDQIPAAHGRHEIIHGEFKPPGADFTPGINAGEPQPSTIFMTVGKQVGCFL